MSCKKKNVSKDTNVSHSSLFMILGISVEGILILSASKTQTKLICRIFAYYTICQFLKWNRRISKFIASKYKHTYKRERLIEPLFFLSLCSFGFFFGRGVVSSFSTYGLFERPFVIFRLNLGTKRYWGDYLNIKNKERTLSFNTIFLHW